ncbi:hypothetical protein ZWY2020_013383 [Hordeum vulgare]|nr:hypothetical protein ZWY2020_013383 [Hordeum vulgare]
MGEASGEGLKVAYQGCPGAYSEAAAKKAYPSCETVPCEYFETAFQGQFRGRPEVTDQREKYLQRLQQVQQQQCNLLNASHITGINQKQFPTQQPNSLLQQILNDSFLELPSNMVSVVYWFFKYAWWFFIEDGETRVGNFALRDMERWDELTSD